MKRFAGVLAVVAVAAAVYVAMASGGQHAGPTAKQFAALKKQVAKLQKQVKAADNDALGVGAFVLECLANGPVAVDSVGSATDGYLFGPPQVAGTAEATTATTALNLAPSTESAPQYRVLVVNASQPSCLSIIGSGGTTAALRHMSSLGH